MVDSPEVRARRIARPLWNLACRAVGGDADSLTADDWGALIAGGLATGPDQIAEGWQGLIESYLNTPVAFRVVSTYQGLLYEASLAIGPASVCVLERFKTRPGPDGGERPVAHDEQLEVAATTGHPLLLLQRVLPPAAELRAPALQTSAINAVPVTLDPATGERLAAVLAANPDADAARRNGHPFFTEGEVTEVSGYGSLMTEARQARAGFILQPETADEGLFRTPLGRCNRGDFPPGRGLWVRAGKTSRVQLPLVD